MNNNEKILQLELEKLELDREIDQLQTEIEISKNSIINGIVLLLMAGFILVIGQGELYVVLLGIILLILGIAQFDGSKRKKKRELIRESKEEKYKLLERLLRLKYP